MKEEADIQEAVRSHMTRNAQLLRTLQAKGVDLTKPREAEHHFWASSGRAANSLADELRSLGYSGPTVSSHDLSNGSKLWSVEAAIEQTPEEAASRRLSESLVRLASQFGAEYDGWGTSI